MNKRKEALIDTIITKVITHLAIPGYVNCQEGTPNEPCFMNGHFAAWEYPDFFAEELRVAFRSPY